MSITHSSTTDPVRKPRRRFGGQPTHPACPVAPPLDLRSQPELLGDILPHAQLEVLATQTQAQDQRKRKLTCVVFFWLMVLGVGPGGRLSLSALASQFLVARTLAGVSLPEARLSRQALSENLKLRPWQFFAAVLNHLLGVYQQLADQRAPALDLGLIQALRLVDTSTLRVANRLIQVFPGHRTGRQKEWAAVKLHMAFRLFRSIPEVLALTAEKVNDKRVDFLLPAGQKALYVFDLGYWKYRLLDTIAERQQQVICRLQEKCNPLILDVYSGDPAWIGQRLRQVCLAGFSQIDVRVNLSSDWSAAPKMKHDLRLVGELVDVGWRFYLTTIMDRRLYPVDLVAQIYALRWQIELLFRDLKCVLGMQNLIALTENGVRLQIYAALIYYVLTHLVMLKAAEQCQVSVEQMSVPKCLQAVGQVLVQTAALVVKDREPDWKEVERCLVAVVVAVHQRAWRKAPSRLSQAVARVLTPAAAHPS